MALTKAIINHILSTLRSAILHLTVTATAAPQDGEPALGNTTYSSIFTPLVRRPPTCEPRKRQPSLRQDCLLAHPWFLTLYGVPRLLLHVRSTGIVHRRIVLTFITGCTDVRAQGNSGYVLNWTHCFEEAKKGWHLTSRVLLTGYASRGT